MTLTEFLLARIAEDESAAREAIVARTRDAPDYKGPDMDLRSWEDVGLASVLVGAERVLAECETKRRIVNEHPNAGWAPNVAYCNTCNDGNDTAQDWPCPTLRFLALPYADHPDYRDEWRP